MKFWERWVTIIKTIMWASLVAVMLVLIIDAANAYAPCEKYRSEYEKQTRRYWGLDSHDIAAVMMAQCEQESGGRPDVCSRFACGLTQFTKATAKDMERWYPHLLSGWDRMRPDDAILAQILYMKRLHNPFNYADTECDRFAMALASYNGGKGWVDRDTKICMKKPNCNPRKWWDNVDRYSSRAQWAFKENREYPPGILIKRQPKYHRFGKLACEEMIHE